MNVVHYIHIHAYKTYISVFHGSEGKLRFNGKYTDVFEQGP